MEYVLSEICSLIGCGVLFCFLNCCYSFLACVNPPHPTSFLAKATFDAISKTYSYLTPDLWKETVFTKSPYQVNIC